MKKDNAAGGQRGLRATPSPALLETVRDRYGIDTAGTVTDLGGSSSLNLLLRDSDHRYVVRVYRPYVTPARIDDIHRVHRALWAGEVPCPEGVPTREGQRWIAFDGRIVEVERYVHRDGDMDSWDRLEVGLPLLARIHTILREVEVSPEGRTPLFANHIEPQEALDRTLRGTRRIRGWGPTPAELHLADGAETLARTLASAEETLIPLLPRQLIHGDFWDNNVFFRGGRVVLVNDFDYMGERARIDDLALTLYFMSMEAPEDRVTGDQLQRLRRLVDLYNSGLDHPLTDVERAALPLAIARQPLWSIGGWVALLDDEQSARRHAGGSTLEVEWALRVVHDLDRWQRAFA